MDSLVRLASRVSDAAVWVAGAVLIVMSFVIGADVIGRKFFGFSMAGTDEIGGYVVAVTSAWAFAFALFRGAHIRIDSMARLMPSFVRAIFDIVGLAALGAFMTLMAMRCWNVFRYSIEFDAKSMSPLKVPLWIPQGLWALGLAFFVVVILLLFVRSLAALAKGDARTVSRLIGTGSDADEALAGERD